MRNPPRSCDLHGGFFAPCGLPKPLPLGEVALRSNDGEGKPGRKEPLRSDRQAFCQSDTIAVSGIRRQRPSPLSLVALLLASSPKGGAIGMSVRLSFVQPLSLVASSSTAPLVGEPLAKPFTLRGLPKPPLGRSNGDDRRQWRKQGGAVGAAASRMRAAAKQTLGAATRAVALRSNDGEGKPGRKEPWAQR